MTPLALVVLLGFGLLIAICLAAWTAVSYDSTGSDDTASGSPRRHGTVRADQSGSDSGQGVRRQRKENAGRSAAVRADRGSRTAGAGATKFEASSDGSNGRFSSTANHAQLSGGAWRSAGGATVTARRVTPVRSAETDSTAADSGGGRGGKPKQTRGASADASERKQEHDEDAFERFLRARPDDIDIG